MAVHRRRARALPVLALVLATPLGLRAQPPALQPFLSPAEVSPAPEPTVRRALPVNPTAVDPTPPEPAAARAVPVETPTPRPRPTVAVPAPTPVQRRPAPVPRPPTPLPAGPSDVAIDPGAVAPGSTPADDNGGGTIRLGPSQNGGGNVVSPDQLQLDAANQLYLKKVYPGAAAEYEKYLGQYPDAPAADRQSALWFMAECYRQLKRGPAAQTTYEQLLSKYDEGQFVGPASYQLADLYFEGKNYRAALALFQRAASLLKAPDALSARYYEALCLENLERRDETKEVYGNLIAAPDPNPYRELARIKLASLAALQKRPSEALVQYEGLSKESTKPALRAEATIKAGLVARQLEQNDKAAEYLERGSTLPAAGPALVATAQTELLHLYYETNQPKKLLAAYNKYARQLPEDRRPEAMLMAGNALRQQGRYQEAREIYDLILREAPNSPQVNDARYQRVLSLYAAKDPNFVREADDFLLLSADPAKGDQVKLMKADTLFDKGDYAAAAVAYGILDNANTLPAKYRVEIAYRLPYAYVQSNQAERAVAAFGRFLKTYPESPLVPKALAQRGLAFSQIKGYDSALSDFNRLIDEYPQAKERELALQQKALLLGQREDARGMADTFRTLLREYPKTESAGQARYYLGTAAYETKDFANARTEFEAAAHVSAKEYGPRAALRVILCDYQLQDKSRLAADLDGYRRSKFAPEPPAQVLRWLGERQMDDRDYPNAEANLTLAAASPSDDAPDTFLKLARVRLLLKRPEPALAAAESFLKRVGAADPGTRANGLITQGEAQLALKRLDDAQKSGEEAQLLQPEGPLNARARLLGGDVAFGRGQFEAAAKAYSGLAILTDDPDVTPQALRRAADAYEKAGKPTQAAESLRELRARFPNLAAAGA